MSLYDRVWAFAQKHPVLGTIAITPWRVAQAFADPVRRRHIAGQSVLMLVSTGLALLAPLPAVPLVALALNYLLYEFVAEPLLPRWFGPYWERGPRDGEEFTEP